MADEFDAARFVGTQAAVDACVRWLDDVACSGPRHPDWRMVRLAYERSAQFTFDVDTWVATSADRFVEADAAADEPRIDSDFDEIRGRQLDLFDR